MSLVHHVLKSFMILALVATSGCAGKRVEERLDQKLAQETPVAGSKSLDTATAQRIAKTPELSPEQRQKLDALRKSVRNDLAAISDQSLKLRSILMKDVVTPDGYDVDEVRLIKSRLQDLENRRLSLTFQAIDDANSILGHLAPHHGEVFRDFTGEGPAGRGRD